MLFVTNVMIAFIYQTGGHIYNNARILNNHDYRSLRVHTLNLCENFMKRPLQTFEREILLFPRLCSTPTCREWRQNLLSDCGNCGQVIFKLKMIFICLKLEF